MNPFRKDFGHEVDIFQMVYSPPENPEDPDDGWDRPREHVGLKFTDTQDESIETILGMIKRDIYKAQKRDELPYFEYELKSEESKLSNQFQLVIDDLSEEIIDFDLYEKYKDYKYSSYLNEMGVHIIRKIAQIAWTYNLKIYDPRNEKLIFERFRIKPIFSEEVISCQLSKELFEKAA